MILTPNEKWALAIGNLIPESIKGLGNTRYNDVESIVVVEETQTPSENESQWDSLEASNPEVKLTEDPSPTLA